MGSAIHALRDFHLLRSIYLLLTLLYTGHDSFFGFYFATPILRLFSVDHHFLRETKEYNSSFALNSDLVVLAWLSLFI